jgi:hypothetical protein
MIQRQEEGKEEKRRQLAFVGSFPVFVGWRRHVGESVRSFDWSKGFSLVIAFASEETSLWTFAFGFELWANCSTVGLATTFLGVDIFHHFYTCMHMGSVSFEHGIAIERNQKKGDGTKTELKTWHTTWEQKIGDENEQLTLGRRTKTGIWDRATCAGQAENANSASQR